MSVSMTRGILAFGKPNIRSQISQYLQQQRNVTKSVSRLSSAYNRIDNRNPTTDQFRQTTRNATAQTSTVPVISPDNIIRSGFADINIPNMSMTEFIFSRMNTYSQDRVAMVDGMTGRSYTFTQIKDSVVKVASALTKLGYKKGDVFCLFSPNVPEYCILFLAISAIGGIITTANPLYSAKELGRQLDHSDSKAVITIGMFVDLVKEACSERPNIKEIIVIGEAEGCRPIASLMMDDGTAFPQNVDIDPANDILALPYSSGTTGLPKGVMLSHKNVISNILQVGNSVPMHSDDSLIGVLPFFHIYGMVIVQFGSLRDGCKMITLPKFDPTEFLKTLQDNKVTVAPIVPPVALFLGKHPLVDSFDLSNIRMIISGAAPLGESSQVELAERLNLNSVIQGYGLTETSPVSHCDTEPPLFGTVGTCVANTEAKVIDLESGELLGPGEEGELCVRGPQVMMGYINNEEATNDMIREGWLHTGDICHYDENGYFTVADRLKELIKYKGFQVPPAELEALLVSHHEITDAAVIGIPDELAGELPKAFIVLSPESKITKEEINQFVDEHVSAYKKLRGGIDFISEIPKSASGKILRRLLRDSQ